MKKSVCLILLLVPLHLFGSAQNEKPERVDPRVIHASLEQRRQWVIEQAEGPGAWLFSRDYERILAAKSIGPIEAKQLAYLFFYSTREMGGYFDEPTLEGKKWKFDFHSELGPTKGYPVFVETETGLTWQEGQTEKVDVISLIKLFAARKKPAK